MRARERKEGIECYMKKEYVKPVIESEEFVANEYVASCWDVRCEGTVLGLGIWGHERHGDMGSVAHLLHDPTFDIGDADQDGFYSETHNTLLGNYTTNHWNGGNSGVEHHNVTVTKNPNASN